MNRISSKSSADVGNPPSGAQHPLPIERHHMAVLCNTRVDVHAAAYKAELIRKVQIQANPAFPATASDSWAFQR